jgi:hypothetical protein
MDLSVPILAGRSLNQPVREIRIDYHQNWQKIHFKSIESAYRHSPFYEYLIDDLREFWITKPVFLLDYNLKITARILHILKADIGVELTSEFREPGFYDEADLRYAFHPKNKKGAGLDPAPFGEYHQVFSDRFGFVPEVSILDLMFNAFKT